MLHSIKSEKLGPWGPGMMGAVQACVHCGFCLAACPTYGELGQEMDTPRGRIVLMKRVLEETLSWEAAQPHIDRCLGCLACEPACPSGVSYRELINPYRALARNRIPVRVTQRIQRALFGRILPYHKRFRAAVIIAKIAKPFSRLSPSWVQAMFKLLPTRLSPSQSWPGVVPAKGEKRARVGLLLGCVQQVLEPDINTATIDVLCRNGVEVIIPPEQGCCGGLAWHNGQLGAAQTFARDNMRAFEGVDAIVTNAAGCGSTMQEYHLILAGTPEQPAAEIFRHRVIDVSVFLARLGLRPMSAQNPRRVAYQDACHLAHAQGVSLEPRSLLKAIPGTTLVELAGAQLCCGSAGTYNLDQPQIAGSLGQKKAEAIAKSGARLVVSGNIGCINQLRAHLALIGSEIPVRHIMQELRDAYIGMPD